MSLIIKVHNTSNSSQNPFLRWLSLRAWHINIQDKICTHASRTESTLSCAGLVDRARKFSRVRYVVLKWNQMNHGGRLPVFLRYAIRNSPISMVPPYTIKIYSMDIHPIVGGGRHLVWCSVNSILNENLSSSIGNWYFRA